VKVGGKMTEIKWIKITTDMFEDEKIDFIASLPEADSIIVIWIRLLTLAGRCNAGGFIYLTEKIPYTEEMLAHKFKKPPTTIKLALETFKRLEMLEFDGNVMFLPNWEKHQNVNGLDKIRESNRLRKQKQRANSQIVHVPRHVTVTGQSQQSHATDKELDLDNIYIMSYCIEYLNSKAGTSYKTNSKATQRLLNARIKEGYSSSDIKKVIDIKSAEWKGTDMAKFLRPETLFGVKFESYLNQAPATKYDHKEELGRRFENVDEEPVWP
jgi:predicted phage replisome organizer/uncharacterized phage protein (TIGR02220 family)